MKVVDQVLSREINPEIVKAIEGFGGKARGFAGSEIFHVHENFPPGEESSDLGFVGEVSEVNVEPLRECIRRSITPVISPTARGEDGKIYNCNADMAAAQDSDGLESAPARFHERRAGIVA